MEGGEEGADASPITVKASVADRIQRALGEIGRNADKSLVNRKGDVAAGMFDRQASVNRALDDVEGLAPARAAFKESIEAERAVDEGLSILNANPDTFEGLINNMSSVQRDALKVGVRQAITDAIGKPTEGATGVLNRLGTATNMKRNLAAALGKAEAEAFQAAIKANVDRLNNARFVAPGTGSQTATRLEDMGLIDPEILKPEGIVARLLNKLRAGATLTDQERELLVRMSQSQGDDVEAVLRKLPKPKRDLSKAIQAASGGAVLATQGGY